MNDRKRDGAISSLYDASVEASVDLLNRIIPWFGKACGFVLRGPTERRKSQAILAHFAVLLERLALVFVITPILVVYLVLLIAWFLTVVAISIADNLFTRSNITKAPGTRLLGLVDFLFSPKTVEQTFKPIVADWRHEYFEAKKQERKWKARWISTRYRFSFIMAMGLSKVFSLFKQLSK